MGRRRSHAEARGGLRRRAAPRGWRGCAWVRGRMFNIKVSGLPMGFLWCTAAVLSRARASTQRAHTKDSTHESFPVWTSQGVGSMYWIAECRERGQRPCIAGVSTSSGELSSIPARAICMLRARESVTRLMTGHAQRRSRSSQPHIVPS
eukprot:2597578-Rhodomonas_salina.2